MAKHRHHNELHFAIIVNVSVAAFHSDPAAVLEALPHNVRSTQARIASYLREFSFSVVGSRFHENIITAALVEDCPSPYVGTG